ncbi:NUDIX domain-containing protein [Streptosporangium sp. NPDC049248]|uniref:NUDIX domain-containing protein n=1 Tax=Streptosporangium sp. NPDC049248 TaxID=3155651 RepID=UPI00342E99A8
MTHPNAVHLDQGLTVAKLHPATVAPAPSATVVARCDNHSVGVLISNDAGEYLMFERATWPVGIAGAAGHVDTHGTILDAARAEVAEELGLVACELTLMLSTWRDNRCRRTPGPSGTGHQWYVFRATVRGALNPSTRETRNARWIGRTELQALAMRTALYASGRLTEEEFVAEPGIEPVWVDWLCAADLIALSDADRAAINELATHGCPPPRAADADNVGQVQPDTDAPSQVEDNPTGQDISAPAVDHTRTRNILSHESITVRAELTRVDAKVALLVSLAAGGLAITLTNSTAVATVALVLRWIAGGLFAAAAATLLAAVMPRIPRRGGTGFVAVAHAASPRALIAQLTTNDSDGSGGGGGQVERLAADVWQLSRLTCTKYRIIRVAVALLIVAVVVLALSLPLAQG